MTKRRKQPAEGGRDQHGRFKPGASGNPKGRPRKIAEPPKLLTMQLADAMSRKMPVTRADGKQEMLSGYDLAVEALVRSLSTAKPREIMAMLEWMEQLKVFSVMRDSAQQNFEQEITEADLAMLERIKAVRLAVKPPEDVPPDEDHLAAQERRARQAVALRKALAIGFPPEEPDPRPAPRGRGRLRKGAGPGG